MAGEIRNPKTNHVGRGFSRDPTCLPLIGHESRIHEPNQGQTCGSRLKPRPTWLNFTCRRL